MRPVSILVATCIVLSAVVWACPLRADVSGRARVIDGDSLKIGGTRVRLFGIDAPERGQSCRDRGQLWICGGLASVRLEERISGRKVVCVEKDRDRYGRIVAVCRAGGEDLNAWMVSEEAGAKAARVGVWPVRTEDIPGQRRADVIMEELADETVARTETKASPTDAEK